MQMKHMRIKAIGIIVSTALCCAQMVSAANSTWNGTLDKVWTNSANWSGVFPSGNETATFNNKTAGAIQEIDLDAVAGTYTITNGNSARTLTFLGAITNGTGGTAGVKTLNIDGVGPVVASGGITRSGDLDVVVRSASTFTLGGLSNLRNLTQTSAGTISINADTTVRAAYLNGANGVITIASGKTLTFNNGGGDNLRCTQDTTINGPGVIVLSTGGDTAFADNYAANGKTLTINAKITGARGFEYWASAATTGTIALNGLNDYTLDNIFNLFHKFFCFLSLFTERY